MDSEEYSKDINQVNYDQNQNNYDINPQIDLDFNQNMYNQGVQQQNQYNNQKDNQYAYGQEYTKQPNPQQQQNKQFDVQSASTNENGKINSQQQQAQQQNEKIPANKLDIRASNNPGVCVAHFIFKVGAILSLDFWTVKNVTGRILVGLRWFSVYDENGEEKWVYDSMDASKKPNQIDQTFFWFINFSIIVFWLVIFFVEFITLSFFWIILCSFCLILNTTNFYGYYKCRGEHQNKVKKYVAEAGIKAFVNNL